MRLGGMPQHESKYFSFRMRANPSHYLVAVRIVSLQNGCDILRLPHIFVLLVSHGKSLDASDDWVIPDGIDRVFLEIPYSRCNHLIRRSRRVIWKHLFGRAALGFHGQLLCPVLQERAAHYISIPERPPLIV